MQILTLTSRLSALAQGVRTSAPGSESERQAELKRLAREPAVKLAGLLAETADEAGKEKLAGLLKDWLIARKLSADLAEGKKAGDKEAREFKLKSLQARLKALQMAVTVAQGRGDKKSLKALAAEALRLAREIKQAMREAGGDGGGAGAGALDSAGKQSEDVLPDAQARELVGLPPKDDPGEGQKEDEGQAKAETMSDDSYKTALAAALAVVRMIYRQARKGLSDRDARELDAKAAILDAKAGNGIDISI